MNATNDAEDNDDDPVTGRKGRMKLRPIDLREAHRLIEYSLNNFTQPLKVLNESLRDWNASGGNSSQPDDLGLGEHKLLVTSDEFVSYDMIQASRMKVVFKGHVRGNNASQLVLASNSSHLAVVLMVDPFFHWEEIQCATAIIILVMVLAGNTSILFRLRSRRRRKSNVNFFIVHLAIADLLVGVICIFPDTVMRLERSFTYGHEACIAYRYLAAVLLFSSSYLLVAMSFDRWQAVVRPLALAWNRKNRHLMVTGAWLVSFLFGLPLAFHTRIKFINELPQCYLDFGKHWGSYMIYLTMMLLVVPTVLIAICYVDIVLTIVQRSREADSRLCQLGVTVDVAPDEISHPDAHRGARKAKTNPLAKRSTDGRVEETPIMDSDPDSDQDDRGVLETLRVDDDGDEEEGGFDDDSGEAMNLHDIESVDRSAIVLTTTLSNEAGKPSTSIVKVAARQTKSIPETSTCLPDTKRTQPKPTNNQRPIEIIRQHNRAQRMISGRQNNSGVIPKARIKTTKMTFVIVAAYVLCWTPFCIINNLIVFEFISLNSSLSVALGTLSQTLTHLNSAVNPIIYYMFSSRRSPRNKSNLSSTGQGCNNVHMNNNIKTNNTCFKSGETTRPKRSNVVPTSSMISTETVASELRQTPDCQPSRTKTKTSITITSEDKRQSSPDSRTSPQTDYDTDVAN